MSVKALLTNDEFYFIFVDEMPFYLSILPNRGCSKKNIRKNIPRAALRMAFNHSRKIAVADEVELASIRSDLLREISSRKIACGAPCSAVLGCTIHRQTYRTEDETWSNES